MGTYAALLPIAAKLWETLGYTPLVQHTLSRTNDFESAILDWTVGHKVRVETIPPLSRANTMRAIRLFAAHLDVVADDDFVLMSDVDIFPVSRSFFAAPPGDLVMFRAAWYHWLGNGGNEPDFDPKRFERPFRAHFAMCYAGATVSIWRELFPQVVFPSEDTATWDELELTRRVLEFVEGREFREHRKGHWQKGVCHFVDDMTGPCLSSYRDMPRGLIGVEDRTIAETYQADAIDWIPPRFTQFDKPEWIFPALRGFYPELAGWLDGYHNVLGTHLGSATWPQGAGDESVD